MVPPKLLSLGMVLMMAVRGGLYPPSDISKTASQVSTNFDGKVKWTLANINNITSWIGWDGCSGYNPWQPSQADGGICYPRNSSTVVYLDGILWGGFVRDGIQPIMRVGGQSWVVGTAPGKILSPGIAEDPGHPAVRIYRIRRDFQTAPDEEFVQDASEFLNVPLYQVSIEQIQAMREQYARDWAEWPAERGAPFYDYNVNGIYEPLLGEEPGLQGADQVIWLVCNDLDELATYFLHGCPPIGLELQITLWGYKVGGPLGQTTFRRYRIINKSGAPIDSMFIALFSDVNVGYLADDLCGCDSVLNLAYAYNGFPTDQWFAPFNLPPPAIGYCLLQGPIVPAPGDSALFDFKTRPDYRNLPMTSFAYDPVANPEWDNPDLMVYKGAIQWYNMMNGYLPLPDMYRQIPFTHRKTGKPTKFPLNGDPVTGSGDVDGQPWNFYPATRSLNFSSGPFTMLPGDTQEVVIAVVGGIDPIGDHLTSVARLKENVRKVRHFYQSHLILPRTDYHLEFPSALNCQLLVKIDLSTFSHLSEVRLRFRPEKGTEDEFHLNLYDDGQHGDSLAGDGYWANSVEISNRQYPYQGDLYLIRMSTTDTLEGVLTHLQLRPSPGLDDFSIVYENGRQDQRINYNETVHLAFRLHNTDGKNPIHDIAVSTLSEDGRQFYIYQHNQTIPAGGDISSPHLYAVLSAPNSGDSLSYHLLIQFDGHTRISRFSYPIVPWQPAEIWHDTLSISILSGHADGVLAIIADPTLLTSHEYMLTFHENPDTSQKELLWDLIDRTTGQRKLWNQEISANQQSNHPVVDGVEYQVFKAVPDFRQFLVVANAAGPLDPPEMGCFAFNSNGFPILRNNRYPTGTVRPTPYIQQSTNNSMWGVHTGTTSRNDATFTYFKEVITQGGARWPLIVPYDWEIRFTYDADNYGLEPDAFTGAGNVLMNVPFELWNIGIGTPDDPNDDFRLFPYLLDLDHDGEFDLARVDHAVSDGDDDPQTDWFYWVLPVDDSPGESGYNTILENIQANVSGHVYLDPGIMNGDVMRRMVLVNQNGGSVWDPNWPANVNATMPEQGTVFRIITTKPHQVMDTLLIKIPDAQPDSLYDWPQNFRLLQNYPNPFNNNTTIPFELSADGKVRIEVYTVLGQRVKVLKDEFLKRGWYSVKWDGTNSHHVLLASGIYVVRMEINDFVESRKIILLK